jgi:integrase
MHDCDFPTVKFPKVSNHRVAFLMPEQADELLKAVKARSIRLWCQCVLGLYAGLRFGEIAGLELQDIDFEGGVIHIRDAKGEDRVAYITGPIEQMFAEWWTFADKKPGLLFPTDKKGRQVNVSSTFAKVLKALGINDGITDPRQKIVFHSLRHSFASWLVMGGENLYTVMALMGHRDISTTMKYAHLAPDIKRDAVDNLVKTLNPETESKPRLEAVK